MKRKILRVFIFMGVAISGLLDLNNFQAGCLFPEKYIPRMCSDMAIVPVSSQIEALVGIVPELSLIDAAIQKELAGKSSEENLSIRALMEKMPDGSDIHCQALLSTVLNSAKFEQIFNSMTLENSTCRIYPELQIEGAAIDEKSKDRLSSFTVVYREDPYRGIYLVTNKEIGEGTFKKAYLAFKIYPLQREVEYVYLKFNRSDNNLVTEKEFQENLFRESEVMRKIQKIPSLGGIEAVCKSIGQTKLATALITPLYSEGNASDYIEKVQKKRIPSIELKDLLGESKIQLKGLISLHGADGPGFIHGDIKPGNLFMSVVSGKVKIRLSDFGTATGLTPEGPSNNMIPKNFGNTPGYIPLEGIEGRCKSIPGNPNNQTVEATEIEKNKLNKIDDFAMASSLYAIFNINEDFSLLREGANFFTGERMVCSGREYGRAVNAIRRAYRDMWEQNIKFTCGIDVAKEGEGIEGKYPQLIDGGEKLVFKNNKNDEGHIFSFDTDVYEDITSILEESDDPLDDDRRNRICEKLQEAGVAVGELVNKDPEMLKRRAINLVLLKMMNPDVNLRWGSVKGYELLDQIEKVGDDSQALFQLIETLSTSE
ncbi:MAG: protein kinase family protein [Oligoflexia bacterium]|nr:protein kinase family protein [Oligoflexia bacterium]